MIITKKGTLVIFITLIFIALLPFSINDSSNDFEAVEINDSSIGYYQSTTCNISLANVFLKNLSTENLYFNNNNYPGIECYGKVTGLDKVGDKFIVSIGTNSSVNLILQSVIWLLLLFIIQPVKTNKATIKSKYPIVNSLILSFLFTFQYLSEARFYQKSNKYYSSDIVINNYYILGLLIIFFIIFLVINDLIEKRASQVINYFPFMFLFVGTYTGLNINFYILFLCFFGVQAFLKFKINNKINLVYFFFSLVWIFNKNSTDNFFDTDKLRGFINSSNNLSSLIFWILVFGLMINGLYYLFKFSEIDLEKIKFSLIISSSSIVILGLLGAKFPLFNFFNYIIFGQNKRGMKNLESIAGNTWRGFSSSAESVGEFFALVILFYLIMKIRYKLVTKRYDIPLLILALYGLYKSNNFAAILSLLIISFLFGLNEFNLTKKTKKVIYILIIIIFIIFSIYIVNELSYVYLSTELLYEISLHSEFFQNSDNYANFLQVQDHFEANDIGTMLILEGNKDRASSSFLFLVSIFNQKINLPFIPNFVAILSAIAILINRTEMWGIFFAKYSPSFIEAIFGYGPLQISDYLYKHKVRLDVPPEKLQSLFLPHSSFFDLLIFYGFLSFGLLMYVFYKFFKNRKKGFSIFQYLSLFLLLNYIKSDSILYISSFFTIIFVIYQAINYEELNEK